MSKRKRRSQSSSKEAPRRRKSTPSPIIPVVVGLVVVAIIAGAIVSITNRSSATSAVAGDVPLATSQALATGSQPNPGVARVSIQEATDRVEKGKALLVDVRTGASYDKAHAAGAVSLPEEEVATRLGELPRDKELILYCTWSQEQQSARVAQRLMDEGLNNVSALLGGFAAWQREGLPVETASQ